MVTAGKKPRSRALDLMIAATAIAAELPLYTTNPDGFAGLDHLVSAISVTRPEVPNERQAAQYNSTEHLASDPAAQGRNSAQRAQ
jgi:hypothetical protein